MNENDHMQVRYLAKVYLDTFRLDVLPSPAHHKKFIKLKLVNKMDRRTGSITEAEIMCRHHLEYEGYV